MRQLVINNIGPISHVELKLKRINVIMGPQSAGKSCVLKIACFCAWAEKRIELEQGKNGFVDFAYVERNLVDFHKLNGFLRQGSKFSYKSEHVSFVCDFDRRCFDVNWNEEGRWNYHRSRISYIPAERNLVAVVPNWLDVRLGNSNILNFVSDWNLTRMSYLKEKALPILGLGVSYYYDKENKSDYIRLRNGDVIDFTNASSGLQSVVPMWVYLDYLFDKQYKQMSFSSVSREAENEDVLQHIYARRFKDGLMDRVGESSPYIGKIGMGKLAFASKSEFEECKALVDAYTQNSYSDIYLEEPELSLFPQTQVDMICQLLTNTGVHKDGLFISTHSPYILYALNNCMLGYLVKDKIPQDDEVLLEHRTCWVDPKEVGVWELRDGELSSSVDERNHTLQDADGLIRSNYFDRVMKSVMNDFTNYSVYYD